MAAVGKEGGGSGVKVVVLMGLMGKDFKQCICLTRLGEDEFWNKQNLGPHRICMVRVVGVSGSIQPGHGAEKKLWHPVRNIVGCQGTWGAPQNEHTSQ